jgi:hypothetical protein
MNLQRLLQRITQWFRTPPLQLPPEEADDPWADVPAFPAGLTHDPWADVPAFPAALMHQPPDEELEWEAAIARARALAAGLEARVIARAAAAPVADDEAEWQMTIAAAKARAAVPRPPRVDRDRAWQAVFGKARPLGGALRC